MGMDRPSSHQNKTNFELGMMGENTYFSNVDDIANFNSRLWARKCRKINRAEISVMPEFKAPKTMQKWHQVMNFSRSNLRWGEEC